MGLFSGDKNITQQQQDIITTTTTEQIDAGGAEDSAIQIIGDSRDIVLTDRGSVEQSLNAIGGATKNVLRFAETGLDESFDFGERIGVAALDTAEDTSRIAITGVGAAFEQFSKASNAAIAQLGNAITSAGDATRSDSANVLNNVVRFGAFGAIAIAALFLLRNN